MIEGIIIGILLIGAFSGGLYTGHKFSKVTQAPKWFQAPVNTERAQAIKEMKNEDDYLKKFMDSYQKSMFMTQDDFKGKKDVGSTG